jgi:hypothetical protein
MTQFNVSVIGSLRNGYTATAEKVANNVSQVSNAPVEGQPAHMEVDAQPEQPSGIWKRNAPLKLQNAIAKGEVMRTVEAAANKVKEPVKTAVNAATNAATDVVDKMMAVLGAVGVGTPINRNKSENGTSSPIEKTCNKATKAVNDAVVAAEAALAAAKELDDAEAAVKADINAATINNEAKEVVMKAIPNSEMLEAILMLVAAMKDAVVISNEAEVAVNTAVKWILVDKKEKNTFVREDRNIVIVAKNAAERAMHTWNQINDMIIQNPILSPPKNSSKGGRYTQRKHTQRKRKYQKRYTARK